MTAVASSPSARSARLGRATPEQEVVLRRAAEVAHKSLTDFILDSACWPPSRPCSISGCSWSRSQYQAPDGSADRPEQANEGLRDLFARKAPPGMVK
ncbi:MAG: DUF1778 domain-containing protein [Burkholderiaceae bacterium]